MLSLEDLRSELRVRGIVHGQAVTLVRVEQHGPDTVTVYYKYDDGRLGARLLYREDEAQLSIVDDNSRFTADGARFRLLLEAFRIRLAYLFDPIMAVHTSLIEPLPHQISAVYDIMLKRQPLRFLLADDPGSGKTIMAGLLIRELILRGDVRRCLVCAPGNLTEQWQDELAEKFQLEFKILTREMIENARGNPFLQHNFLIVRLDQMSRRTDADGRNRLQELLDQTEWDLIICDEAHKLSASYFGGEIKETKRYKLGKLLGRITRHFLLMTATPHNGKEADFQLFMALLDEDRFENHFRDGVEPTDASDMMRRMLKENLLRFDGTPLFPERKAYTGSYELSGLENALYQAVTDYVCQEFNRAEQLDNQRKTSIGFALTILQRRLASSPAAIYFSLQRRRKSLQRRLQNARQVDDKSNALNAEDLDELDDMPEPERERLESELLGNATAARNIQELEAEIARLRELEEQARELYVSGQDRKWNELRHLLQTTDEMRTAEGTLRKLVIFTEHRDTLNYLKERLDTLFGRDQGIVIIHGSLSRQERRRAEERFRNDPSAVILLATDAAGEGINLQCAHLMINYDLPWNPNRLEQRFGRIHRIGQTEVCHMWNLVAKNTRESVVYERLLKKLEAERNALNGRVFDVLGKLFEERSLRELLIEAVRYGDDPQTRCRLQEAVDNLVSSEHLRKLLQQNSLAITSMDTSQVLRIREDMERAIARRLQPFYVKAFFIQAFRYFNGQVYEREPRRYTINRVPSEIIRYAESRALPPITKAYDRICFEKALINVEHKPKATFIHPGHPLLDATLGLFLERERHLLEQGCVLIDETDPSQEPRLLFCLELAIRDGLLNKQGEQRCISREVHFIEIDRQGQIREAGSAPHLDYRPLKDDEQARLQSLIAQAGQYFEGFKERVINYANSTLSRTYLDRIRKERLAYLDRVERAVHERLIGEILYWDRRAAELAAQEKAGKPNARINSEQAHKRAQELEARLEQRKEQLKLERMLEAAPSVIVSNALIVPIGLLLGKQTPPDLLQRRVVEQIAVKAVIDAEIALGNEPRDVSDQNLGYDIESLDRRDNSLRFIEVKGRRANADEITLTYNELYCALNSPERFILALVEVADGRASQLRYVRGYPFREPDPAAVSVTFKLSDLLKFSAPPH
ncbi:MAG: RNA helicase [Candidatus Thermofonsia Clade 1 bacterium]|uniref:RNA helicase n=1 Tax=Candidatus Thermofonsia Clade 1 bacterium TaxID=2364210 RepID=A0A2M8PXC4_9CHLR|nr:MAG: RNA helicase [Candidatus Thermofonsia Clade 1 bacterium]PJF42204.1 MAG: RNA helicase [Candidatus Thermofonsia Clade 1 bacterium]